MERRKVLSISEVTRGDLSRLGAHQPHERTQPRAPEDRSECWKSSGYDHDCRNKESQRQEMDARRQTKGGHFADRPAGSQILDRDRFKCCERRLGVALTDARVLPLEEALIQSRRFATDVPVTPFAPGSCAGNDGYLCSTLRAAFLASHFGGPRSPAFACRC